MIPTVACVLRQGGEYRIEHVVALRQRVLRWWPSGTPLRFVVFTNEPGSSFPCEARPLQHAWQGWWSKMEMFAPEHADLGDILYFDLDTIIVGGLTSIALQHGTGSPNQLTLLQDFYKAACVQSGMMYLPAEDRAEAWAAWSVDPGMNMRRFRGDGEFLDSLWRQKAGRWQQLLPGQVVSYKVDVRQRKGQVPPQGARVVCFHGRPRPWLTPLWSRAD